MPVKPAGATPRTTRAVPNETVSSNLNALVKTRTSPQKQFQNPPDPTKLLPRTNPPAASLLHHELLRSVTQWQIVYLACLQATSPNPREDRPGFSRFVHKFCMEVSRLRRDECLEQRLDLQEKRLALEQTKTRENLNRLFWSWTRLPEVQAELYPHLAEDTLRLIERDRAAAAQAPAAQNAIAQAAAAQVPAAQTGTTEDLLARAAAQTATAEDLIAQAAAVEAEIAQAAAQLAATQAATSPNEVPLLQAVA